MMHRDKVIGLALSILLVGIVAAFFFRPNADEEVPPQLADPDQLNSRIAERPVTPYLTSPEFSEPATTPEPRAATVAHRVDPPTVTPHWELPDFLQEESNEPPEESQSDSLASSAEAVPAVDVDPFELNATPPDPIQITETDDQEAPIAIPIPRHNAGWEIEERPAAAPERTERRQPRMHVVQQGDTLSELAYEYLGTSTRFLEIYEANRDRLKSPNDLRVGMTIRIPKVRQSDESSGSGNAHSAKKDSPIDTKPISRQADGDSEKLNDQSDPGTAGAPDTPPQPAAPNPETDSFEMRSDRPSRSRTFVPIRRSPLNPGRRSERSSSGALADPIRSLTQVPPIDVPVLDDGAFSIEVKSPAPPSVAEKPAPRPNAVARESSSRESKPEPHVATRPRADTSNQVRASEASQQSVRRYKVRRGDSLEGIAVRIYGTRTAARRIYEANRNQLRNPNSIRVGMTLILP